MVTLWAAVRDLALATILTAIFAATLSSVVHSEELSRSALRQACVHDVRTLCAGVTPGGGRIKQCIVEKYAQVSDGCKDAMKQARALSATK
jgi:hypothetical protein